ncbi:2-amino-4-hydroxy-6-hydroxymethyldihydropteridine diphosphokinase [Thermaerobacter subterraneus]|uniref:2-amino-4-hydroxy-6-hydroxymethyldihydropteridine diphosphokinase n=1 Tax=Thermaerobacter subterraneus DSM 13965 TaxID=867903 RepID=K6QFS4_9FIRM|nr:2-amino-4-hydroxy-6-hydroxymethyldihydropteridine diphosphokinase [Thermaerobacter subterraneus]EKP95916.1 2-amino-4-hydroxy-6-hydroxymethyldihydropteridine pyrophosphokinase [Thermaerobacter subterraneus DSM 13965]
MSRVRPGSDEPAPVRAYLGLGANLGRPREQLRWAVAALAQEPGITVTGVASLYGSRPVGVTDQPDFLNTVVAVDTTLPPGQLLDRMLELERRAGRVRLRRWGPRTLDIDLLWYGGRVIHDPPRLIVPHPRAAERAFVLIPWAELAPGTVVPGHGRVADLCAAADPSGVWLEEPAPAWWQRQESPPTSGE